MLAYAVLVAGRYQAAIRRRKQAEARESTASF